MNGMQIDIAGIESALMARAVPNDPTPLAVAYTVGEWLGAPTSVATITGRCQLGCAKGVRLDGSLCECWRMRALAERWTRAKLPPHAATLKASWDGQGAPWGRLEATSRHLVATGRGPLFYGQQGRGKTWQALGIAVCLLEMGVSVRWVSWPGLRRALIDGIKTGASESDILRPLASAQVLAIDDLGVGKAGEWMEEIGYALVDRRSAAKMPILGTCNGGPAEMERYLGQRVWGRLTACCGAVEIAGESRRTA